MDVGNADVGHPGHGICAHLVTSADPPPISQVSLAFQASDPSDRPDLTRISNIGRVEKSALSVSRVSIEP